MNQMALADRKNKFGRERSNLISLGICETQIGEAEVGQVTTKTT